MAKIAVLVDSGCQIVPGSLDDQGIYSAPLTIEIEGVSYKDLVEIDNETVFNRMNDEGVVVKTSQPSTGSFIEQIEKIKAAGYDHIIGITIGTGLSSTLAGLKLACDMETMPVSLIDSKGTAANHRYLAQLAKRLIDQGKSIEEIETVLRAAVENSATIIMTPNLDQLRKGGRITPAVAMLGKMLKIVPIMKLNYELGGKIDKLDQVRTIKKANKKIIDVMIGEGINNKDYIITIQHVLAKDMALEMKDYLLSKIGPSANVFVDNLPSVVGAHMGVGGIGYQYIKIVA